MSLQRQDFSWALGHMPTPSGLPTVSNLPFEAHPFTMASISEKLDGTFSPLTHFTSSPSGCSFEGHSENAQGKSAVRRILFVWAFRIRDES